MKRFKLFAALVLIPFIAACSTPTPTAPTVTVTAAPSATPIATQVPTDTPTPTFTATATIAKPSATATVRRVTPAPTGTPRPTNGTQPHAERGATLHGLTDKPAKVIYVLYIHPQPDLVWDTVTHQLLVGLCNTIPRAMGVPQGKYKVVFTFPLSNTANLSSESKPVTAELTPGFNEVNIGPWVLGMKII